MEVCKKRFYDTEKEERWLNEMSAQGLALKELKQGLYRDTYTFEESETRYVYRVDYSRDGAVMEEITAPYVMFVTGACEAEYLWYRGGKVYFRKAGTEEDFPPLYADPKARYNAALRQLALPQLVLTLTLGDIVFIGGSTVRHYRDIGLDWFVIVESVCMVILLAMLVVYLPNFISLVRSVLRQRKALKAQKNRQRPV